jgi:pimeloyl-ACP methyl ester carboxylesterase
MDPLAFRLLPGERRLTLARPDGALLCAALREAEGRRARGTLLFIHGAASNASRWEEFIDESRELRGWRTLRLDLRAHASSRWCGRATLERHADDLAALIGAAGGGRTVAIGHSLGAQAAMTLARRHPDAVSGLALLDPLVTEALTPKAQGMKARLPYMRAAEAVIRFFAALGLRRKLRPCDLRAEDAAAREALKKGGAALEEFVRAYSSPIRDLGHIGAADYLRDMIEAGRPTPAPESFSLPVLVLGAASGVYIDPQKLAHWCARLEDGTCEALPCTHWPLTECPERVRGALDAWLAAHF